jgi:hypothetical protein
MSGEKPVAIILLENGYVRAVADAPVYYKQAEKQARHAALGIWRGRYVLPWRWRDGERLEGESGHAPRCPVKAVHLAGRGKIYYVPMDHAFHSVRIRAGKGDVCLGSDEAARKAGYRRP